MKKLISISPEDVEYVKELSRKVIDPRAKSNFSKGLRVLIQEHKKYKELVKKWRKKAIENILN